MRAAGKMVRTARKYGWKTRAQATRGKRKFSGLSFRVNKRVRRLERMIETKEATYRAGLNISLPHNNTYLVLNSGGAVLNPFQTNQGAQDPMEMNNGNRIGDSFVVKGLSIKGFFENALSRAKVWYRVMLVKAAKGDTINRSTLFKGDASNRMIDQVNTERFKIIAQKTFTINTSNLAPNAVDLVGVPSGGTSAGIGTKIFKMWVPGYKFGRGGFIQFENASTTQVKFFDYRLVVVAYDWFGTPEDVNNVGKINELYTKIYFKDA